MSFGWCLTRDSGFLAQNNQQIPFSGTGAIVSGNRAANMTTAGYGYFTGPAGIDDGGYTFPAFAMDFYFFGTNYGNQLNSGIYWNTNNVIGFGVTTNTISWVANTGRGVLIGNADRRTNTFWYSPVQSNKGFQYISMLLFAQNNYSDGIPNAIQWQIRMFRSSNLQYIEVSSSNSIAAPSTAGAYNITNGTAFQNTFGSFTNLAQGGSYVLQSDGNGNNWTFFNNSYVNA